MVYVQLICANELQVLPCMGTFRYMLQSVMEIMTALLLVLAGWIQQSGRTINYLQRERERES